MGSHYTEGKGGFDDGKSEWGEITRGIVNYGRLYHIKK